MPYLRLLGAQVAIGAAAIFARYALEGAGPFAVSALRLTIAALLALAFAGRLRGLDRRREVAFGFAGLVLALHFATWIASLQFTSVAISTLLVTTTPLWTETYELLRTRKPPSLGFAFSLALALGGVALISLGGARVAPPVAGHEVLGDALALAGSLAFGAYLIVVRDARERAGIPLGTRQIVARTYGWGALALIASTMVAHQPPPALSNGVAWFGVLGMALVSQLLGHTALNASLRDFTPSTIALATLLEPIVAALLAAWLFGETLGPRTLIGGALVLVAVALALRPVHVPQPRIP